MEDGVTIELLSIAIVAEDGREFYRVNADADLDKANDWVIENVFPELMKATDEDLMHKQMIARDIREFVGEYPEFWAYYSDYGWVVMCQLFGTMMDLPLGWPKFCLDVKQYAFSLGNLALPEQTTTEHHALYDARWTKDAFDYCSRISTWMAMQYERE